MQIADLPGRYFGFDRANAAALAHKAAMRDAISLIALSGTSYLPNTEIAEELGAQIMDRTTSFSIHARRALEIYDIRGIEIEGGRWRFIARPQDYNEDGLYSKRQTSFFTPENYALSSCSAIPKSSTMPVTNGSSLTSKPSRIATKRSTFRHGAWLTAT